MQRIRVVTVAIIIVACILLAVGLFPMLRASVSKMTPEGQLRPVPCKQNISYYALTKFCKADCVCGDGVLAPVMTCFQDAKNTYWSNPPCRCSSGRPEQCDDGNTQPSDGCSALCRVEASATCTREANADGTYKSHCTSPCGNGRVQLGEDCDDSNRIDGDGCSSKCKLERGFDCFGAPSKCHKCGNGKLEPHEQCDDGNTRNNDGCSYNCGTESGYQCTGDPSVCVKKSQ